MATLHSAGLHEPTGLQYLIDEGFLSEDSKYTDYKWTQQPYVDGNGLYRSEEVLTVDQCVIWSRNGSIKRVFNLDVEGETIFHAFTTSFPVASDGLTGSVQQKHPALVVVLRTQAHIFCLSGAVHVIPLSFEVARAIPFAFGCILQPACSSTKSSFEEDVALSTSRWEAASSLVSQASFLFDDRQGRQSIDKAKPTKLPTYCITDLLSEIGLVAASYNRNPRSLNDYPLLSPDEELLYASTDGSLPQDTFANICLAVTLNRVTATFTIWQVETGNPDVDKSRNEPSFANYRKRQSSNFHERARVTSARGHPELPDESFGGLMKSFVEMDSKPQSSQLSNIADLAAELGQDFEPVGVQTRSARRISSMLARTDLAPATDRSAFNETTATSRKSLSRAVRRDGSIGSFTERSSFGGRRSFPATASIYSNATSFLDASGRFSVGEAGNDVHNEGEFEIVNGRLKKEATLTKLKSFACHESAVTAANSDLRILLIPHPKSANQGKPLQTQLSVCVHECQPQQMTVVTLVVKETLAGELEKQGDAQSFKLKAIQIQKGTNIDDACVVMDHNIWRLLVLSKTSQRDDVLHLEAPWSPSFRLHLPEQYLVHPQGDSASCLPYKRNYGVGVHRVLRGDQVKFLRFVSSLNLSYFVIVDGVTRTHLLQVSMQPKRAVVRRALETCRFILPAQLQDSLLIAFWEISRWLENQSFHEDQDVTALAITLFAMAIPFMNTLLNKPSTPGRRKKQSAKRLSSGSLLDMVSWVQMQDSEKSRSTPFWMQSSAWAWTSNKEISTLTSSMPEHRSLSPPFILNSASNQDCWLLRCTDLTREFLQSPEGESMSGPEGYLPTAINQDRNLRRTALASVVVALYLLLNELELENLTGEMLNNDETVITALTMQLSTWLNWKTWTSTLKDQLTAQPISDPYVLDRSTIDSLDVPSEPFTPSSIFEYIDASNRNQASKYHTLVELIHSNEGLSTHHPLVRESMKILPNTSLILASIDKFSSNDRGVALDSSHLSSQTYMLPEVLAQACAAETTAFQSQFSGGVPISSKVIGMHPSNSPHHTALRDVRTICTQALDAESLGRWDVSSETDRQAITKLVFSKDRRFQEAAKLVNQARPPEVEYDPQSNWTEADALEAQKLLAQYATRRTFAVVSGRGLMHYNARTPLLTEMVPRAQFSMQCMLRSRTDTEGGQSMTFSADRTLFTEDKVSWAFFHNGASAGLMISKSANFIDTSWILYNKPPELTNRHAGFLLALGLNGHLKTLAKWVAFKYLTPKHMMTSVGLLLGLAATYRGTMDTLITRLLSVHVTCLLPPGAAELNLSPLTQTTGLIGIGLVYHNSQHRRMSDVMMAEIETQEPEDQSGDEPILRDEGYRLAAGISLGLINLGHGLQLHSLHDMRVVERLLSIAVGTKNVNLVHVLDRATAGAVIAIAFIFMKTNDVSVARKIDIPDTMHQFDYVRPDVFLLRTLARHLIMWDAIHPEYDFIKQSLPQPYRHRVDLRTVKCLITNDLPFFHVIAGVCFALALRFAGSQRLDARDLLLNYLDQFIRLSRLSALSYDAKVTLNGIRNCLDILALSCATVMAGSGDLDVYRRLRALHGRTDKDTPFGSHLATHMAIGALFLSGGTATFGTSNIAVASLVIAFYPLFPTDVLDNRGHLQALRHLWVLAVEHRCLLIRDAENNQVLGGVGARIELLDGTVAALVTPALLPELSTVKSITVTPEGYSPLRQDLDAPAAVDAGSQSINITLRDLYEASSTGVSVSLQRRDLYDRSNVDQFQAELQALDRSRGVSNPVCGTTGTNMPGNETMPILRADSPIEWIFDLPSFHDLDQAERALTLTSPYHNYEKKTDYTSMAPALLALKPTDTRLGLDIGTLGPEDIPEKMRRPLKQDKLWQIRILLAWADRMERERAHNVRHGQVAQQEIQKTKWLRDEFIERLRWRVWKLGGGSQTEGLEVL